MRRSLSAVSLVPAAVAGLVLTAPAAADDYSDPAYAEFDADNVARSSVRGTQRAQLTDPEYHAALAPLAARTWLENLGGQVEGLRHGRVYTGLGRLVPGGAVGDPQDYHDVRPVDVSFVSRTGAELHGHLFWDGEQGPHPGVVITPGSIQGMQQSYWWAARTLARNGYLVLTWDAQGQGDSEGFGHDPGSPVPAPDGVPSQQEANFDEGTIDALRFLLSEEDDPYVPGGWEDDDADAVRAKGQGTLHWSNPLAEVLDATEVGLAGHSLGARAVSKVQECSGSGQRWRSAELCGGRPYPIRAVVAWDALAANVTPVVPAMNQQADGYFLTPQPAPRAPDPTGHLDAFDRWRQAGVDVYDITVRGGTHVEWNEIPYILPTTTYGTRQVGYYTLAWFERHLRPEPERRELGTEALLDGPVPDGHTGGADEYPWRANFFSARYPGAFDFTGPDGNRHAAEDLRAYAGLSPVGDWAGANADRPDERPPG
ncbi:hypothetical protein SAMN06265360_101255 [Haloechinothrix alba]|uniref:Alpha/beta hydrolase family protein n=1 Tax=Haloechinothrix alba TaxID=664784 RepID=A0A238V553_9PSEU|nr:hypothetical protein [Haloechinothrix alba]SNR28733.1 hypothetical protein SAMN06265360_101255 [Haloechinothrix alba]